MYIRGGSIGSAVDEKNEELIVLALSVECIYVVARLVHLARQWMNEPLLHKSTTGATTEQTSQTS